MIHNNQKFESVMFEYCSEQAERSYKLLEDQDQENGLDYLAHLADILLLITESKNDSGTVNIGEFTNRANELTDIWKEQLWAFLQEKGFGQFIPE